METLKSILPILQIIISVLLITVVLLQSRGTGLSGVFGGSGNVFRTKRGIEKTLHILTIIFSVIFFGAALTNALL